VKFFPETTEISIAEISPKVKKKTGLGVFDCRLQIADFEKEGRLKTAFLR
jgi:hypothetical protein